MAEYDPIDKIEELKQLIPAELGVGWLEGRFDKAPPERLLNCSLSYWQGYHWGNANRNGISNEAEKYCFQQAMRLPAKLTKRDDIQ